MTFEELKKQYTNPVMAEGEDGLSGNYCVGGAFCKGQGINTGFPNISDLARYLREYDTSMLVGTSRAYAGTITNRNDDGDFNGAWDALGLAMNYKAEEA